MCLRLVFENIIFDFFCFVCVIFGVLVVVVVVLIILFLMFGLNFGIDFCGGIFIWM